MNRTPAVIVINPKFTIRVLAGCTSLLIIGGLASDLATSFLDRASLEHYHLVSVTAELKLDAENNVPTWFSTIYLFLCATALTAIAVTERRSKGPLYPYWFGLAATFGMLSLDEEASFHEKLIRPLRLAWHTGGPFFFAWVIPGSLFVLGFLLVYWKFMRQLPGGIRRDVLVAGLVYCAGCLGMEMIDGWYLTAHGRDLIYSLMTILEESLEMIGEILFLRVLLAYLASHTGSLTVRLES